MKEHRCKCGKSHITIDPNNTDMVCGVVGIIGFANTHIFGGIVECASCKETYYKEGKTK